METESITIVLLLIIIGMLYFQSRTKDKLSSKSSEEIILDSCALIDGRIIEIARSGFLRDKLIVPKIILSELQNLADHGDSHKRERARYGLDIAKQLQDESLLTVVDSIDSNKPVDEQLIKIAKERRSLLYTVDYNLNKVAQIEGVIVLNVNELAQNLRPHVIPGEKDELKILTKGQDKNQGVGYSKEGVMVVVEGAGSKIGQTIKIQYNRMLQTQAGRMLFANIDKNKISKPKQKKDNSPKDQFDLSIDI